MAYRGLIVPINLCWGGMNGTRNSTRVSPDEAIDAENISLEGGVLRKAGGATKYNSTTIGASVDILGGWDWRPDSSTKRMVVLGNNGKIYKGSSGTFTAYQNGSGADAAATITSKTVPVFVEGNNATAGSYRRLFILGVEWTSPAGQLNNIWGNDDTNVGTITEHADWTSGNFPITGTSHGVGDAGSGTPKVPNSQLWVAGAANRPHTLYYSVDTAHTNFTGTGSGQINVFSGEGDKIVGLISFKGYLLVFKWPYGIYMLNTLSVSESFWNVRRITDQIGLAGPRAFAKGPGGEIIFMSPEGSIYSINDAAGGSGSFELTKISEGGDIDEWMRTYAAQGDALWGVQALYYENKREFHFAIPKQGSTTNTWRVVLDFNRPDLVRWHYQTNLTPISLWNTVDSTGINRPTLGDDVGFVWQLDQSTKSVDGSGFPSTVKSGEMDFSRVKPVFTTTEKRGEFLELIAENVGGGNTIDIAYFWDGKYEDTVQFNVGKADGPVCDTAVCDDAILSDPLYKQIRDKKRITGEGRTFSLELSQDGPSTDFAISQLLLHMVPGDERFIDR